MYVESVVKTRAHINVLFNSKAVTCVLKRYYVSRKNSQAATVAVNIVYWGKFLNYDSLLNAFANCLLSTFANFLLYKFVNSFLYTLVCCFLYP